MFHALELKVDDCERLSETISYSQIKLLRFPPKTFFYI